MNDTEKPIDNLLIELRERAKELACLYRVQELLSTPEITLDEICTGIIQAIPPGWQYPDVCQVEIAYAGNTYRSPDFKPSEWAQSADIIIQDEPAGYMRVFYTDERPAADEGPFLKEERKLIDTIADQFGFYILHQQLRGVFQEQQKPEEEPKSDWSVILDLLKRTDPSLLMRISRKMITYLSWNGVQEVERLLELFGPTLPRDAQIDENRPLSQSSQDVISLIDEVFALAGEHLPQDQILENIQKWIEEDRSIFLVDVLVSPGTSLADLSTAIDRFHFIAKQELELTSTREKWFRVALIRRILSDQPQFVEVAKRYIDIDDFRDFLHRVIYTSDSHGKLGGKSSGLFLAAQILNRSPRTAKFLGEINTPKTWYLTSDCIFHFMNYNNLEDIVEQKYKDLSQVRQEYPYILHVFKNSPLPPEIDRGLSQALDDFGDVPLIVRSSSLLEDRANMAFAGKYKSLFIANKGTKEERLAELVDAICEVFASMFAPDPIEYRYGHRMIDYHEEMGILIQEVVGTQVGRYYLPAFAGVAFSNNEYPWSRRIKSTDGLIRAVPGLGTRAVDRLKDDYPILIAPGQPNLRVNITPDEIIHYSPQKVDVINLETKSFETVDLPQLLRECGEEYPLVHQLVSLVKPDQIQQPTALGIDFESDDLVMTFEGLFTRTPFLERVKTILDVLAEAFSHPVDIEFAHDGEQFHLLQCRAQSYVEDTLPAVIPRDAVRSQILFSANRHISNGSIPDITHLVYVDPQKYSDLSEHQDLIDVGRVVGMLNALLPKRQFILLGPGRWGSRGDIKLGVNVSYSDINNTAMLIEIAHQHKGYQPEPSFGTHFFLDLVETSIRYLALYPDDPQVIFREEFLTNSHNLLPEIMPDYAPLAEVIRVIDIPTQSNGQVLNIYMNANIPEAQAILSAPTGITDHGYFNNRTVHSAHRDDIHWRWRMQAVSDLAAQLDPQRFGVIACYLFGSAKNATAGPASDIDLLIHFRGSQEQRVDLMSWLEGWSLSLSYTNYIQTGYATKGLLDVHLVSDEDIKHRRGHAARIGATSDPARLLKVGIAVHHNNH